MTLGRTKAVPVVVANNHRLALGALEALFEPDADIDIVAMTHEPERVLGLVGESKPHLLLLDAEMGGAEMGTTLLRRIRAAYPSVAVVLLTESLDEERASAAFLTHGVKGIIEKSAEPEAFAPALRAALRGETPQVGGPMAESRAQALGLTKREESVLRALADGHSNDEIARELWIAKTTVKFHLRNAYAKLGVETRIEALRVLVENAVFGEPYNWL